MSDCDRNMPCHHVILSACAARALSCYFNESLVAQPLPKIERCISLACSFLYIQIACFSLSFIFSAYWLLHWARFQLRLLRSTSSPADRMSLPSEHARERSPAKVWRHFGAFTALACAGKPGFLAGDSKFRQETRALSSFFFAGTLSGIVAWSFNIQS